MRTDSNFCMNSYLMYRAIVDENCRFSDRITPWFYHNDVERSPISSSNELEVHLQKEITEILSDGPVALMLSSGIDSAILASFLPEGTQTYTLHCIADNSVNEIEAAKHYAEINNLKHKVIDIFWNDYEEYTLPLMKQKGCPIHSIEVQVYKAALQAKKDGIKTLIFGETADIIYGGHSKLLARDWTLDEFTNRFSFVDVKKVLRHPNVIQAPILPHVKEDGNVDVFGFLNAFEYNVSLGFYNNACLLADVSFFSPYASSILGAPLDIQKIRNGESKYIIRELFKKIYPDIAVPEKTPLPRPMSEWLKDWTGPLHNNLFADYLSEMTGDQKWYIFALNKFLTDVVGE